MAETAQAGGGAGRSPHAFITGASSGIGEALARALAREGYAVTVSARRAELLDALCERIRAEGGQARAASLDVARASDVAKAVEEAEREFGPVELLVANAGVGINAPAHRMRVEWIDQMVDVNLKGAIYPIHAVLPGMVQRGRGHVVGISSLAGYRGLPTSSVYSATKAGLSTFLEGLRPEVAPHGVRVTDVCPGFIKTPMTAKNKHPMPFLMDAEAAAGRIVRAIREGRARYGFPWPMHALMRFVQALPSPIFDFVARRVASSLTEAGSKKPPA